MLLLFLLSLSYNRKVMEVLFSVKLFDVEFLHDLYVLTSFQVEKCGLKNLSGHIYVRMHMTLWGIFSALYLQY